MLYMCGVSITPIVVHGKGNLQKESNLVIKSSKKVENDQKKAFCEALSQNKTGNSLSVFLITALSALFFEGAGSGSSCGGDQTAAASLLLSLGSGGITLAFPCCLL